jgi:hypothetical protein
MCRRPCSVDHWQNVIRPPTPKLKEDILMKALCWHGKNDVRVDTVPEPEILEPTDAIIKISAPGISGSDLHLYD